MLSMLADRYILELIRVFRVADSLIAVFSSGSASAPLRNEHCSIMPGGYILVACLLFTSCCWEEISEGVEESSGYPPKRDLLRSPAGKGQTNVRKCPQMKRLKKKNSMTFLTRPFHQTQALYRAVSALCWGLISQVEWTEETGHNRTPIYTIFGLLHLLIMIAELVGHQSWTVKPKEKESSCPGYLSLPSTQL